MTDSSMRPFAGKAISPSARMTILGALMSLASKQVASHLDAFIQRLEQALTVLAQQPIQTDESDKARTALLHLQQNKAPFQRLISSSLDEILLQEIRSVEEHEKSRLHRGAIDLSLVTFDAMEQKILLDNMSRALDEANAENIEALNVRVAYLLQRDSIVTAQNPFRPEVFLKAVSEAWAKSEVSGESQRLVLQQMRPDVFLPLEPVLHILNEAMKASGLIPDMSDVYRIKKSADTLHVADSMPRRSLPIYARLNRWLSPSGAAGVEGAVGGPGTDRSRLNQFLSDMQKQAAAPNAIEEAVSSLFDTSVLHLVRMRAPEGTLTAADENAIELLARVFDRVFVEQHIPDEIKQLIGRLQLPVLKAALSDDEFFFRDDHPVRRLVETVAKSSVAWEQKKGNDDPLYRMIENVIDRVQQEYDQQIELFDNVANDLEAFVAQEEQISQAALAQPIAAALQHERVARAKEIAAHDVAVRIENGNAAGFVEVFLETQWIRVLCLAHAAEDAKPEARRNALQAMDDLIWSVQPKDTQEERKELLGKLPALLSLLNAWLTVIKWEGPERVAFFSTLAERHMAIVRAPFDSSPRAQLEKKLNETQKASERRLNKRASEEPSAPADEFIHLVDGLEIGTWIAFTTRNGTQVKRKLAWVSPRRTRFVFAGWQGQEAFTSSFDELAQFFRAGRAAVIAAEAVVDRAINTIINELTG